MNKRMYEVSNWYMQNYKATGSKWLIDAIIKTNPKKDFKLVSIGANAGYYEKDAYDYFTNHGYSPTIICSDGQTTLREERVQTKDGFIYYEIPVISNEIMPDIFKGADIILDFRAGLWYTRGKKRAIDRTLINYMSVLNTEGVVIIDAYHCNHFFLTALGNSLYRAVKRFPELTQYREQSTLEKLQYKGLWYRIEYPTYSTEVEDLFSYISNEGDHKEPNKALSDKMKIAIINKEDLEKLRQIA